MVHEIEILSQLNEQNFVEVCVDVLVGFCCEEEHNNNIEPNISPSLLESRAQLEVRARKCMDVNVTPSQLLRSLPPITAALVVGVADTVYNVVGYDKCPLQAWNERGLFRLLFKCITFSRGSPEDILSVRASVCRSLSRAASRQKCVRVSLAHSADCLEHLFSTLQPLETEQCTAEFLSAQSQALRLTAAILSSRAAAASALWRHLEDARGTTLLSLILQCLEFDDTELQESAIMCLTQITESIPKKPSLAHLAQSRTALLESLPSPYDDDGTSRSIIGGGDAECKPQYLVEELTMTLIKLFRKMPLEKNKFQSSEGDLWCLVSASLTSLMAGSGRARGWAAHCALWAALCAALGGARAALQLRPPAPRCSAANNPVLRTVHFLLLLLTSCMVQCRAVKEAAAESGLAATVAQLWSWCMYGEHTREAVLNLLIVFTNDCAKAWSGMCVCVSGRNLISELCALVVKESARLSPVSVSSACRRDQSLCAALTVLTNCRAAHCTTIMINCDVLSCLGRLRGVAATRAAHSALGLAEMVARSSPGAAALLKLRQALPAPHSAEVMTIIAHAAHHHRTAFLHSESLLEQISSGLTSTDVTTVSEAARAVWALAANCHKAKLALRSAGVSSAADVALQRLRRAPSTPHTERAIQLLTYTNTVLHNV